MEETMISSEFRLSELRRQNFRQTMNQLEDRVSSALLLTVQYKDIDDHFSSLHKSVEQKLEQVINREKDLELVKESANVRFREIEDRENELELKAKLFEEKEKQRFREIEERENEFELKAKVFEEKEKQIELKERMLMERIKEFELKENTHVMTEQSDFIQGLIKSNRRIEAIKYIYQLKMVDKFPPVCILNDHLRYLKKAARKLRKKKNNSIAAQIDSIAKEMAGLRTVINCIATYCLEYEVSPKNLKERVAGLEKKMAEKKRAFESSNTKVGRLATSKNKLLQQQKKKKNFSCSSFATPTPIEITPPSPYTPPHPLNTVTAPSSVRASIAASITVTAMSATAASGTPITMTPLSSPATTVGAAATTTQILSPFSVAVPEIKSKHDDERSKTETSELDLKREVFICGNPDFGNFERERAEIAFAVNQLWAIYDSIDGMPRFYARIRKVLRPGFKLQITWLEPIPDKEAEQQWHDEELPIGCGRHAYGETYETVDHLMFSHKMDCVNGGHLGMYYIYPKKGETWALFKDWDLKWSLEPDKHRPPYEFEFVEVVTDFIEDYGIGVAYLGKVKGFVNIFQRSYCGEVASFCIRSSELYRFSHRVPSVRMSGKEGKGVPPMYFKLDTCALPSHFASMVDTENILKNSGRGPNKGTLALGRSPRESIGTCKDDNQRHPIKQEWDSDKVAVDINKNMGTNRDCRDGQLGVFSCQPDNQIHSHVKDGRFISPIKGPSSSGCKVVEVEVYDFKKEKSED